jgi:hypothetical protein
MSRMIARFPGLPLQEQDALPTLLDQLRPDDLPNRDTAELNQAGP